MFKGLLERDVNQIFVGSVMMYDKQPVYILSQVVGFDVMASNLDTSEEFELNLFSPQLSIRGVNTGNVNVNGVVVNFFRCPVRRWKQGLCRDNIEVVPSEKEFLSDLTYRHSHRAVKDFQVELLKDTLKNEYPSFEKVLGEVGKNNVKEMAFDRQFSLDKEFRLYYKKEFVGAVNEDNGEIFLAKKREYLRSLL